MYENYLAHYGVLGMRWGHRSAAYDQARATYKSEKKAAQQRFKKGAADWEKETQRQLSRATSKEGRKSIKSQRENELIKNKNFIDKFDKEYDAATSKYKAAKKSISDAYKQEKAAAKSEKDYIKAEAKYAARNGGLKVDVIRDGIGNVTTVKQAYDSKNNKIGADMAQKIINKQKSSAQAVTVGFLAAAAVGSYLLKNY